MRWIAVLRKLHSVADVHTNNKHNSYNKTIMITGDRLGSGHYLWRGVAPKRNVFRGNNFADPTIKKSKI
jgi:hypothetical protein